MKVYEKPKLYFESFELNVGIALECGTPVFSVSTCGSSDVLYNDGQDICSDGGADEEYCEQTGTSDGSFYS